MQISPRATYHSWLSLALAGLMVSCADGPTSLRSTLLHVRAEAVPSVASLGEASDSVLIEVNVFVTNPLNQAVIVELGGPPYISGQIPASETNGIGFGLRVLASEGQVHGGPALWTWGKPVFAFPPRGTLSHTFRLTARAVNSSGIAILPGRYRLVPSFGHQEGATLDLTVQEH